MDGRYTYIWEFEVHPGTEQEFLRHYGPEGSWINLFRQDPAYIGTQLLVDQSNRGRYVTVDTWQSVQGYKAFRNKFANEYDALDRLCDRFTAWEASLGSFAELA